MKVLGTRYNRFMRFTEVRRKPFLAAVPYGQKARRSGRLDLALDLGFGTGSGVHDLSARAVLYHHEEAAVDPPFIMDCNDRC